ncbi:hypothetical protein [Virgibacillus sp. 6R]|uniref:hypothetical protein n=1 Tax=Metabacillus niabensis TaxID=324854 RepID=UPI0016435C1F
MTKNERNTLIEWIITSNGKPRDDYYKLSDEEIEIEFGLIIHQVLIELDPRSEETKNDN